MSNNLELTQMDNARQIEYRKKFQMVKQSLISIGFSVEDVQSIFTILAAILHIGDIAFSPHGPNDGVRVKHNGTIEKGMKERKFSKEIYKDVLFIVAELLQLSAIEFSSALVTELQVTTW